MASLTKSQQLVYDYLCSTMAERAVPPSVREICAATVCAPPLRCIPT